MIILGLEGLDKSGKKTQSELLYQALFERGYNVARSEFHRYDTPTGALIRSFLDGEYKTTQLAIEAIMAADKLAQLDWIKELEEETDILILDRYLTSQFVYGHANGTDIDFTSNMLSHMPPPDFQIYFDITPEESMKRKGEHGDNDLYESNHQLLSTVRSAYQRYFTLEESEQKAMILEGNRPEQEIHQLVLEQTLSLLEKGEVE